MRIILTAAALATVFAVTAAKAEPTFDAAGPKIQSGLCKVASDPDELYGYLAPCVPQVVTTKKMKRRKS